MNKCCEIPTLRKDFYVATDHATPALMDTAHQIEESLNSRLNFNKLGDIGLKGYNVLPVVVQDIATLEVLLVAYVNAEALRLSLAEKQAVFFSTSRGEIWRKGKTSGDVLILEEVRVNCEQNSLLFLVRKKNTGSCHTKDKNGETRSNCYYRRMNSLELLEFL